MFGCEAEFLRWPAELQHMQRANRGLPFSPAAIVGESSSDSDDSNRDDGPQNLHAVLRYAAPGNDVSAG